MKFAVIVKSANGIKLVAVDLAILDGITAGSTIVTRNSVVYRIKVAPINSATFFDRYFVLHESRFVDVYYWIGRLFKFTGKFRI